MPSESVKLHGHIVDSLTLSKVLDTILLLGGEYEITRFDIGATPKDMSEAEIRVISDSFEGLEHILHEIGQHGANRPLSEVTLEAAPMDGVFPDHFYSTTNLESWVRLENHWVLVENIEMDCGILVEGSGESLQARCVPIHRVKAGDRLVVGDQGVRVEPLARRDPGSAFSFMGSATSSERPKELVVTMMAESIKTAKAAGKKVLFVGGPAIIHTGAGKYLEQLIFDGWIDVLFAGNALATHDIESALLGTSLGIQLLTGAPIAHGHEHHLRAINAIRRAGSIASAVESGLLTRGIMHACIKTNTRFVLAGSIRDDGPLPDVITDAVQAQDAMRSCIPGIGVAMLVATTLHSVATGNMLPAAVQTICVDSDADTVIKLMDRGTHQAYGLVTDCEFFLKELAAKLHTETR